MDYSRQWFGHLFKENYPLMYRMAFSMVENADDAKDAVNQVFTQMWKGKPQVSDGSVKGYLLAATRNQCLHLLRQRWLKRQLEEELQRDEAEREHEEREELLRELQHIIDNNLTEQDKRVLQLHYDEEMDRTSIEDDDAVKGEVHCKAYQDTYDTANYDALHFIFVDEEEDQGNDHNSCHAGPRGEDERDHSPSYDPRVVCNRPGVHPIPLRYDACPSY